MLAFLVALIPAPAVLAGQHSCRDDAVILRTGDAQVRFEIELAVTPAERSRGLMFRESLPRQSGMLFVFDPPQRVAFWMKNTLIPLDMLFVDRSGTVARLHSRAVPGDETPIDGGREVFAVLEINGGLASELGLGPGTVLRHRVFEGGPAAWPC